VLRVTVTDAAGTTTTVSLARSAWTSAAPGERMGPGAAAGAGGTRRGQAANRPESSLGDSPYGAIGDAV